MVPTSWPPRSQTLTAAFILGMIPMYDQTVVPTANFDPQLVVAGHSIRDSLQIETPDSYGLGVLISEEEQLQIIGSFAARLVAETKDLDPDIVKVIEEKWWDLI